MPNKIAFWIPNKKNTGLGHYYRNLGYVEQLKDSCFFVNTEGLTGFSGKGTNKLLSCNSEEPSVIESFLVKSGVKFLIIDNYFLSEEIMNHFSSLGSMRTLLFCRDEYDYGYSLILNSNPFAKLIFKNVDKFERAFLGETYYLFREEIARVKPLAQLENSVFICIGATDHKSIVLELLKVIDKDKKYIIVLGAGCDKSYLSRVSERCEEEKLDFELYHNPDNFFEIMGKCKSAILSSSTIVYEALYLGLSLCCINTSENQNYLVDWLKGCRVEVHLPQAIKAGVKINFTTVAKDKVGCFSENSNEFLNFIRSEIEKF